MHIGFKQPTEFEGAEVDMPDALSDASSRPAYCPVQVVETLTHRRLHRIPPLALTCEPRNEGGARGVPSAAAAGGKPPDQLRRPAIEAELLHAVLQRGAL